MNRKSIAAIVLGVAACATAVHAPSGSGSQIEVTQSEDGVGSIIGIVRDDETRHPTEAIVVVQCTCLPSQREAQADANGVFALRDLPPGEYTVQALGLHGGEAVRVLNLPRGGRARVDFVLSDDSMLLT